MGSLAQWRARSTPGLTRFDGNLGERALVAADHWQGGGHGLDDGHPEALVPAWLGEHIAGVVERDERIPADVTKFEDAVRHARPARER